MIKSEAKILTISVKEFPKEEQELLTFLNWMGKEFISQGGLVAVDIIVGLKGKYRVYKDTLKKNNGYRGVEEGEYKCIILK